MGKTRIKVCGITRLEDAEAAVAAGADALGFVFYAGSSRHVTPPLAAAMAVALPPFVTRVGLFVNAPAADIMQIWAMGFLHAIQLHGDESPHFCQQLRAAIGGVPLIKAIRVAVAEDLRGLSQWPVQAILLDAKVGNQYGGTGHAFDWSLLHRWPHLFAEHATPLPLILAGGLTPERVASAVQQVRPYAVDVSSGVEKGPGIKCPQKIKQFIQQVQQADPQYPETAPCSERPER
ncbi:MAG: phosphoribosylanthranilate isomerase [Magnetococcales bacterium]|nr:phosphoribosylanthranilate isomerase [Magnetococcales bacterium]